MNGVIMAVMAVFLVLGGLDRIFGNRFGLGEEFENGINAIAPLALSMLGIICLAPVLAELLRPVIVPVFRLVGADPGMFPGCLLACDMGGAALAVELAEDPQVGYFGGVVVGAMLGGTISFTIPASISMLRKEDQEFVAQGVLAGIVTIPFGALIGGLTAGMELVQLLRNLLPVFLFSILIALGLWKARNVMVKGFRIFGQFIQIVITVGVVAAGLQQLTGIVVIPGMTPLADGFRIVGEISIVLAGAFPLVKAFTMVLRKPLMLLGHLMGMNEKAAAGMIASLANSLPMFAVVKDMDDRGKVLNMAFAVSGAFVFGDHLGFTAGFAPEMLTPMIVAKLTAGIFAVALAMVLTRKPLAEPKETVIE